MYLPTWLPYLRKKLEVDWTDYIVDIYRERMPFRFPEKFAIPKHSFINTRVIRDQWKRVQFEKHEVARLALKYIARNTELPARARIEAQLQLALMPLYTAYNQIHDRCVASGNSKSVISDFKLNRTAFRNRARAGLIPGVKVASW